MEHSTAPAAENRFFKVALQTNPHFRLTWIVMRAENEQHALQIADIRCQQSCFTPIQGTSQEISEKEYRRRMAQAGQSHQ
jgi:hypothetical protein